LRLEKKADGLSPSYPRAGKEVKEKKGIKRGAVRRKRLTPVGTHVQGTSKGGKTAMKKESDRNGTKSRPVARKGRIYV